MRVSRFFLYPFAVSALAIASSAQAQTDTTKKDTLSVATTVSDDQVLRGLAVFTKTCSACHEKGDVSGADFKVKWNTRPVYDLFDVIHTTMPDDAPGTMTRDQYIDVVTYLLRLNGAPAGGMPISHADTVGMRAMKISITVPPPDLSAILILKVDSTAAKKDTLFVSRQRKLR